MKMMTPIAPAVILTLILATSFAQQVEINDYHKKISNHGNQISQFSGILRVLCL